MSAFKNLNALACHNKMKYNDDSGAPLLSKSTHPRKFHNHVTVHRPPAVRPHHRKTNVYSHTFN